MITRHHSVAGVREYGGQECGDVDLVVDDRDERWRAGVFGVHGFDPALAAPAVSTPSSRAVELSVIRGPLGKAGGRGPAI
jgi:hypothetical protein